MSSASFLLCALQVKALGTGAAGHNPSPDTDLYYEFGKPQDEQSCGVLGYKALTWGKPGIKDEYEKQEDHILIVP